MAWPFNASKLAQHLGNPAANTTEAVKQGNLLGIPGAMLGDVANLGTQIARPVAAAVEGVARDPYVGPLLQRAGGAYAAGFEGNVDAGSRYDAYILAQDEARQRLAYRQMQEQMAYELSSELPDFNPMDMNQMQRALGIISRYDPGAAMEFALQMQKAGGGPKVLQHGRHAIVADPRSGTFSRLRPATGEGGQGDAAFPPEMKPSEINAVRSQWADSKKAQAYEVIASSAQQLRTAYEEFKRTRNPQAYAAVVTKYAQMLDPNSIVREAEFDRAERFLGLIDKMYSQLSKAAEGVASEKVIEDTMQMSEALLMGVSEDMLPAWRGYTESARGYADNMGVDPSFFWSNFRNPEDVLRGGRRGGAPQLAPTPPPRAQTSLQPGEEGLFEQREGRWVMPGGGINGEELELIE